MIKATSYTLIGFMLLQLVIGCNADQPKSSLPQITISGGNQPLMGYPEHSFMPANSYYTEMENNRKIIEAQHLDIIGSRRRVYYNFSYTSNSIRLAFANKYHPGNIDLLSRSLVQKGFTFENRTERTDTTKFPIPGEGIYYYNVNVYKYLSVSRIDTFTIERISKITTEMIQLAEINNCYFHEWKVCH